MRAHEAGFRARLEDLRDIPIVGDVRGAGYFRALEMVPDQETDARFTAEQREELLRGFLLPRFYDAGLIAAPTTAATPSCSSRRRSSRATTSSTSSPTSCARS